jgi:hypothetical protein
MDLERLRFPRPGFGGGGEERGAVPSEVTGNKCSIVNDDDNIK